VHAPSMLMMNLPRIMSRCCATYVILVLSRNNQEGAAPPKSGKGIKEMVCGCLGAYSLPCGQAGRPPSSLFPLFSQGLRPLFGLGFVLLKLAIATSEASSSCNSEPHLRVIFRVARLKFLLVLRLPAGIDLRDQVDLAPARSITIGSWFSDC